MDLCTADLHSCSKDARCVSQGLPDSFCSISCILLVIAIVGPGMYDCVCPDGLWGENCIPR